jgi:hypothetical protein
MLCGRQRTSGDSGAGGESGPGARCLIARDRVSPLGLGQKVTAHSLVYRFEAHPGGGTHLVRAVPPARRGAEVSGVRVS